MKDYTPTCAAGTVADSINIYIYIYNCAARVFCHWASFLVQAAWGVPDKAASKE